MPRALWNGVISFGLLNIPVSLQAGQRTTDLHFRMLDSRDNARIRFERVNADTGEEVPWKQIVKAFEYEKGNYVVLDDKDFERAAPESHESVEIESFVARGAINPMYFEKPYYLVPGKRADKGYVLLREVLKRSNRVAVARVVIRTREHLSIVMPLDDALVLLLIRYPQELITPDAFQLPGQKLSDYRLTPREIKMAEELVDSMTGDFNPDNYVDDFRRRLHEAIDKRIKADETVQPPDEEDVDKTPSTNVVDFMALLKKSLAGGSRTAGGRAAARDSDAAAEDDDEGNTSRGRRSAAGSKEADENEPDRTSNRSEGRASARTKTGRAKVAGTRAGKTAGTKTATTKDTGTKAARTKNQGTKTAGTKAAATRTAAAEADGTQRAGTKAKVARSRSSETTTESKRTTSRSAVRGRRAA
jgi:DNA end-binding protein Ku